MSLARSYAKAWVETLESRKDGAASLDSAQAELTGLAEAVEGSRHAKIALGSPATTAQEKEELISALSKGLKLSTGATQLLQLLAQKGRLGQLAAVVGAIEEVRVESKGGVMGLVESPDPLSEQDLKALGDAFSKKVGKQVRFKWKNVPTLLAGLRVTLQGVTYDGSLSAQLARVREKLIYDGSRMAN